MRRLPLPLLAAAATLALVVTVLQPAPADVIVLKNGSRVEGDLERTADGYTVTLPGGKAVKVKSSEIKSVEVKPPATADEAKKRLESLRRSAENLADLKIIVSRYNDFLRRYGETPQGAEARQDLAQWQDRLERHMTKAGGKWVTPEELGSIRQQAQDAAAKARDAVAQGRLGEDGPLLDQALSVDPKNASAHYLRGVVLFRQDQLGPARKSFDTANQLVPDHAPTLNNLAVILWRQENFAGALRFYDLAMHAADDNGPAAEAVLNNVAEALHALPKPMRDAAPTKRVVLRFQERENSLVQRKEQRGLHRWGSAWVDGAQLDKLLAKEKEIENRIKDLESEFQAVQNRIEQIDQDIQDTERTLRRMEATSYVRDPVTGRTGRTVPPRAFYGLQRDLQELNKERAVQEAKVAGLRREAKMVRQELPVPRYGGVQRIIDADGAPLLPAAEATGNGV